jgi:hypothetical protein
LGDDVLLALAGTVLLDSITYTATLAGIFKPTASRFIEHHWQIFSVRNIFLDFLKVA